MVFNKIFYVFCKESRFPSFKGDRSLITLVISKCYGEMRVLFLRSTSLVSAGKSHSPGVRGVVVRSLLFDPVRFFSEFL